MKINEQYHNLNLLENVTYEFLGRDGEAHEETEPILVEHMMNVYVNGRLTMKLVCIPEHLAELVLGRLFTEGIISSADDIEQIYICEFGKRARVILNKNKSGQPHEENEDYIAQMSHLHQSLRFHGRNSGSSIWQTVLQTAHHFTARPGQLTAVFCPVTENCFSSVRISAATMHWTKPSAMLCATTLI